MDSQHDPLDQAFDSLRSHGATLSDSYSKSLEDRLMQEQTKQKTVSTRRIAFVAFVLVALVSGGVASYAATDGWQIWPWSVTISDDGTVTDASGNVIGTSVDNEDGTSTTVVQMGQGHIEIKANESLRGQNLHLAVEPPQ